MTADVLVIGGGPAGASAAIRLARAGVPVTLVERERAPAHKVCGEFLSGEALFFLEQLGIDLPRLGAVPLTSVRLTHRDTLTEAALPFPAMSLTRRCLDQHLLLRAEAAGVRVLRATHVQRLERSGDAWRATLAGDQALTASTVFLATGKHDLRGHPRPEGKQRGMVALKMYWRLSPDETRSLGQAVELIPYPGGYAGLQPVEAGLANLCCLIHADVFRRLGATWPAFLAHITHASLHLRRRLSGAEPQLEKPLTIASLPYGFVRRHTQGLWYLGDQAAVIPSFTGDGMSLALHTGALAASLYLRNETAQHYQQTLAAQVSRQVALATAVSKTLVRLPGLTSWIPRLWPGAIHRIAQQTRIPPAFWAGPTSDPSPQSAPWRDRT